MFRFQPFEGRGTSRSGAAVVLIMLMLLAFVMLAGVAINTAHLQLVRTELQIASDLSARASGRMYALTGSREVAFATAERVAGANLINGRPFAIHETDLEYGRATRDTDSDRYHFETDANHINAVRVMGRLTDDSAFGPVTTLFPIIPGQRQIRATSEAISTQVELDIVLVIDRSGSMAYADTEVAKFPPIPRAAPVGWFFDDPCPPKARWLDLVDAVDVFLEELKQTPQQEFVSLVTYAGNVTYDIPLTDNYDAILRSLQVHTDEFKGGGTNIHDGLDVGIEAVLDMNFTRPWTSKVILLMTDGHVTVGRNPRLMARIAAKKGITIFTVTFADEADQRLMRQVAADGGGEHFHASTREDLIQVFREIGRHLPTFLTR